MSRTYYTKPSTVHFESTGAATAVAYDAEGRTFDIHHWRHPRWAQLHASFLNAGMNREEALLAVYDAPECPKPIESYTGPNGEILWKITAGWSDFHATDAMAVYEHSPQGPVTKFLCGYKTEKEAIAEYDRRFPPVFEKRKTKA